MSAYGHEMEREYSAQSILAGEGSGIDLCHLSNSLPGANSNSFRNQ